VATTGVSGRVRPGGYPQIQDSCLLISTLPHFSGVAGMLIM
jgi:hypothetical protein